MINFRGLETLKPQHTKNWTSSSFDSLAKFTKYLEVHKDVVSSGDTSDTGSYNFTQTNNLAEAIAMLKTGSPKIEAGLKDSVKHAIAELQKEINSEPQGYVADVQGLFFDIAKVVEGDPEAWYREPWDKTRKPKISVPIMGTYPGRFNSEDAIKNASAIIALIKAMEDKGIEVELYMMFLTKGMYADGRHDCVTITIKGYNESFNWRKLSAMLHPSFFRRCLFRYNEIEAGKDLVEGYGGDYQPRDLFVGGENMLKISDAGSVSKFKTKTLELLRRK